MIKAIVDTTMVAVVIAFVAVFVASVAVVVMGCFVEGVGVAG